MRVPFSFIYSYDQLPLMGTVLQLAMGIVLQAATYHLARDQLPVMGIVLHAVTYHLARDQLPGMGTVPQAATYQLAHDQLPVMGTVLHQAATQFLVMVRRRLITRLGITCPIK